MVGDWPASRIARPKQFMPISGGVSMIEETYRRLKGLVPAERVLVVTAENRQGDNSQKGCPGRGRPSSAHADPECHSPLVSIR